MSSPADPIRRLYRVLLALYPRAFRARYEDELLEAGRLFALGAGRSEDADAGGGRNNETLFNREQP